ncbi:hypothetical protein BDV38DRAFT_263598 [Aspergillus pseudotamarii]|uniref:Uncharacterized protein n=1 Tax=Aspergillus pseudotamarii TaxID=132259 RepID=A0A5N6SEC8_ASPPS|nr:uncharacterized protein BDV38DRAFT_263598 [Aspergillus pseudotamarii]KAE8131763.1 hypothetical protein BDV38DRAFT_263598 [Aspergillus pseudotamarii]
MLEEDMAFEWILLSCIGGLLCPLSPSLLLPLSLDLYVLVLALFFSGTVNFLSLWYILVHPSNY